MAIKNCDFFEVMMPQMAHKYGLVKDIEIDNNGMVHSFNAPGLGVEIDFDLIKSKYVNKLS